MTNHEEFEQWWIYNEGHSKVTLSTKEDGTYYNYDTETAFRAYQYRGERDAARIAELESRLISREIELQAKIGDLSTELAKLIERISKAEAERDRLRKAIEDVPYDAYYIERWKREVLKGGE
jgi:hypothetical protein